MSESKASLRFDHREIAVIFSLFIFVSLLMFTVGILVGKGLAQAKYEGVLLHLPSTGISALGESASGESAPVIPPSSGTSVSTDTPREGKVAEQHHEEKATAKPAANEPVKTELAQSEAAAPATKQKEESPLELVPKTARDNLAGRSLAEPGKNPEADELMRNPKLRALVDNDNTPLGPTTEKPLFKRGATNATGATNAVNAATAAANVAATNEALSKRANASAPEKSVAEKTGAKEMAEASLAAGPFTVQVGSYPTDKDAAERVEALKKLGFSHAYFSAKQWSDTKETWFRVWLGYYPDYESAKRSGRALQERGEVTNYLVRKTDAAK